MSGARLENSGKSRELFVNFVLEAGGKMPKNATVDALEVTNELLFMLVRMMSCPECEGTGLEKETKGRCQCRVDASDMIVDMSGDT